MLTGPGFRAAAKPILGSFSFSGCFLGHSGLRRYARAMPCAAGVERVALAESCRAFTTFVVACFDDVFSGLLDWWVRLLPLRVQGSERSMPSRLYLPGECSKDFDNSRRPDAGNGDAPKERCGHTAVCANSRPDSKSMSEEQASGAKWSWKRRALGLA